MCDDQAPQTFLISFFFFFTTAASYALVQSNDSTSPHVCPITLIHSILYTPFNHLYVRAPSTQYLFHFISHSINISNEASRKHTPQGHKSHILKSKETSKDKTTNHLQKSENKSILWAPISLSYPKKENWQLVLLSHYNERQNTQQLTLAHFKDLHLLHQTSHHSHSTYGPFHDILSPKEYTNS